MDGGDLKTLNRWHGGDLKTVNMVEYLVCWENYSGLVPGSCLINNMVEYLVCWENYSGLDLGSCRNRCLIRLNSR